MKTIIIFLMLCSICYAGDYVCHDDNGRIVAKYRSVDGGNLDKNKCFKITREKYQSLTRWHEVKNGKVVVMSKQKKEAVLALEAKEAKDAKEANIKSGFISIQQLMAALETLGIITKEEITDEVLKNENISVNP